MKKAQKKRTRRLLRLIPTATNYQYKIVSEEEQKVLGSLPVGHPDRLKLFNSYIPFALKKAVEAFKSNYSRKDILLDDLVQESLLGLLRASQLYRFSKGKFITYAWGWTESFIRRFIRRTVAKAAYSIEFEDESSEGYDTDPFDRYLDSDKDTAEIVIQKIFKEDLNHLLASKKNTFKLRTHEAICRYFGFEGYESSPLEECGKQMGMTKERARQLIIIGCQHMLNDPDFSKVIRYQL